MSKHKKGWKIVAYYQRLRDLREDSDLTQSDVAKILNTSYQYYSKYEAGLRPISFERVIELAKFYNVSIDYIAGLTNDKQGVGCVKQVNVKHKSMSDNDDNKYNSTPNNNGNKYNIMQNNSSGINSVSIKNK